MADANWSNQLHIALEEWAAGRTDRAERSFHRVLEGCQSDEMLVWRAFLHNQLALLCQETGQWEEARHHWEAAQQSWTAGGVAPGSPQLAATLGWYADILDHYQFRERARILRQEQRIPLIDPWQSESPVQSSFATTSAAPTARDESYLPMGGNSVSVKRTNNITGTWDELVTQALELAARANFPRAQNLFDQARHQVVARRVTHPHLLALVYSAESIGAFVAGQYPPAEKARDQAKELWRTPESGSEDLQLFAQALKAAGQESAAALFMSRVGKHEFPLLDPLTDLQSGVARGHWKAAKAVDWLGLLEEACKHFARGNLVECQRRLDSLALQMEPQPAREALLGNLQALLAHAQGEEEEARTFYNRARTRWTNANLLSADLKLLRRYKLEKLADALQAGHLLDPADHPLLSEVGSAAPPPRPEPAAPLESMETPARSFNPLTWVLVLILALMAAGVWRLTHS